MEVSSIPLGCEAPPKSMLRLYALRTCARAAKSHTPVRTSPTFPQEHLARDLLREVFRDLFINQMNLLDRAVKMVAELDEPLDQNFVRRSIRMTPFQNELTVRNFDRIVRKNP